MSSLLHPSTPEGASAGAELVTSDGRSLALVAARLVGEAQGGLARLVLEQKFENAYDENLRVTYRMPLPADGAVSGYEFVIGERVVKGVIDRKAQARERFERAIVEGKTAALLEQERADIFTQQIGNIPPREAIVARITIDQRLVWLPEGEWELRFPTVIGPRYIGSADTAADVRATHIKVTDQPLRAGIQIAIKIGDAIRGGGKPSSPTHLVDAGADGTVALRAQARLDRDIALRWAVATPGVGLSLNAARPQAGSKAGNDAYGLLTIVPPARDAKPVAVARDLIVLIDTSGSMGGGPLDKAKQVIAMMLDSLDPQDRFELIEFSNNPRRYLEEPVSATPSAKQAAIKWVRKLEADGATEMRAAVIEAMQTLRVGAQRQVVVVTDGYVGGEQQILEAMNRRLPKSCRVHVLGVGSAVNRSLATSLARAGRGVEIIVGIDDDAERGAKRLLDRTRMPVLTNVEISGSALLRHAPERIPDVFEGAPLVAALAMRAEGGELVVRGQLARESWEQTIRVPAQQPGNGNQAIVALYARERVADVEANALFATVDGEIEELGLAYQIATRMTSWLAIDEVRRVTGPSRDQLIPQELPYGTRASAFGLRTPSAAMARTQAGVVGDAYMADLGADDGVDDARYSGAVNAVRSWDIDQDEETGEFGEEAPREPAPAEQSTEYDSFDAPTGVRRSSIPATRAGVPMGAPPAPLGPRAPMGASAPPASAPPPAQPKQKTMMIGAGGPPEPEREAKAEAAAAAKDDAADLLSSGKPAPAPAMKVGELRARKAASEPTSEASAAAPPKPTQTGSAPFAGRLGDEMHRMEQRPLSAEDRMVVKASRRRLSPLLAIMLLLALIALLLWWLLA